MKTDLEFAVADKLLRRAGVWGTTVTRRLEKGITPRARSVKTPYWIQKWSARCPNAFRLGRIAGEGNYALLSCRDGESRHVRLFMFAGERNRAVKTWDRIGHCGLGSACTFDHVLLKIDDESKDQIPSAIPTATVRA